MELLAKRKTVLGNNERLDIGEKLSCFYFFLCFWEPYLNMLIGSVTKYFLIVVIVIIAVTKDKLYFRNYHYGMLIWFALRFLSVLWAGFNLMVRMSYISMIGMVLYYIILTTTKHSKNFVKYLIYSCYFSSFTVCLASLFFSQQSAVDKETRIVLTVAGLQIDPNNEAALKLFCFIFGLFYLLVAKKFKWIHVSAVLISAYTILLTGSRGGFVAMAFGAIVFYFVLVKEISLSKKIAFLILLLVVCGIVFVIAKQFLPVDVFNRLFSDSYDGGANRTNIWNKYLPLFYNSPLWGAGWGSYFGYNGSYAGCHNIYVEVLVETGLIGFVALYFPIFKSVVLGFKKGEIATTTLLAAELMIGFFLGSLNKRFFWLPVIMCALVSFNNMESKYEKV